MLNAIPGSKLSFQARCTYLIAILFVTLVAFRIHGSSMALLTQTWDRAGAMNQFLASPILDESETAQERALRAKLMAVPRNIRVDEWSHATPWVLAQFSHTPRFPVINQNIGDGANMLVSPWVPVSHPATLARPVTWGYLLFGAQAGLAWAWWFQPLVCFLALVYLFQILIPGRNLLALLGSAWYCGSAYVVCWSLWPAYLTGMGALCVVCAYRLMTSRNRNHLIAAGLVLGIAFSAFVLYLYPPWQVPLAHVFLFLFIGLLIRDRPYRHLTDTGRFRLLGVALALLVALIALGSYFASAFDALRAMAETVYPGQRRLLGGDCSATRLFSAFYNYATIYKAPFNSNESESAGYFLLFPAVIIALLASARARQRIGIIAWILLPLACFFLYFCMTPIPEWLANVTLLSRVQGYRSQLALGLVSIILCMQLLAAMHQQDWWNERSLSTAAVVFTSCFGLFLVLGWFFQTETHYFVGSMTWPPVEVFVVSLVAAVTCAVMALGLEWLTAGLVLTAVIVTAGAFNPLSRGFRPLEKSEMYRAFASVLATDPRPDGKPSLWLTFGPGIYPTPGMVAQIFGARSIGGVHQYPQLDMWRKIDPEGQHLAKYNRYAIVQQFPAPISDPTLFFNLPHMFVVHVKSSPLHPAWRNLNVRYIFNQGPVGVLAEANLIQRYASAAGDFQIFEIPESRLQ
ncbi:MAG TPA: hypothetical protein VKP30_13845 [Polyangiaceae bacterium]|nr:hypothetical protein [Polyangiaceae bacterium]